MPIVDSDTHIIETEAVWKHLDPRDILYKPQAIELEEAVLVPPIARPMKSAWVIDGRLYARTSLALIEEASDGQIKPGALSLEEPAERLKALDQQGVDMHVIFPSLFLGLNPENPAVDRALTRAYNRYLAERCAAAPERLRWVMLPALSDIAGTLKEMEWARKHGAIGVGLRGLEGNRPIDHPDLYPIFAKADELDMPVCVHIGNGSHAFAKISRNAENRPSRFFSILPALMAFNALLTSPVYQRFPKLRFGFFETGSAWLPYLVSQSFMVRDDRDRAAFAVEALRERNIYVTCEEHEELAFILKYAGDDHLVIGSDYGHPGDVDSSIYVQKKFIARPDVTDAQKHNVLNRNAVALFGLPA